MIAGVPSTANSNERRSLWRCPPRPRTPDGIQVAVAIKRCERSTKMPDEGYPADDLAPDDESPEIGKTDPPCDRGALSDSLSWAWHDRASSLVGRPKTGPRNARVDLASVANRLK